MRKSTISITPFLLWEVNLVNRASDFSRMCAFLNLQTQLSCRLGKGTNWAALQNKALIPFLPNYELWQACLIHHQASLDIWFLVSVWENLQEYILTKKLKSLYLYIEITEVVFSCPLSPFHFPSDQAEKGLEWLIAPRYQRRQAIAPETHKTKSLYSSVSKVDHILLIFVLN